MTDITQLQAICRTKRLTLTDEQKRYRLRPGKRYSLGANGIENVRVIVVDNQGDWIEFNYQDKAGHVVGRGAALTTADFRALIVAELPEIDTGEGDSHDYH